MRRGLVSGLQGADQVLARFSLGWRGERPALLALLLHGVYANRREVESGAAHPMEGITTAGLRAILLHFLEAGYQAVGPDEILEGLSPDGKYLLLTFDDSYYRTANALPVLEELQVPALMFFSTRQILEESCYWWDVVYRERFRRGMGRERILGELQEWKGLSITQIHELLVREFGVGSLRPTSDLDRPFTVQEVRELAQNRWVYLGNHTVDHQILTACSIAEAQAQIERAQLDLHNMSGMRPVAIAYPNGNSNEQVVAAAQRCGLRMGVSVQPEKVRLPLTAANPAIMTMGRFGFVYDRDPVEQSKLFRSDYSLYRWMRQVRAGA